MLLIPFPKDCVRARFVAREKRFTVHCELDGRSVLAHTNNTGTMLGLLRPGCEVLLSPAANPNRKLPYTLELSSFHSMWVGVNTLTPNRILRRAFEAGAMPELRGYDEFRGEARTGDSRLDAKLTGPAGELWVECKNVTLVEQEVALFPDAETVRGRKHLTELMRLAKTGARVALFFLVQRADGCCFGPADMIDPEYADFFYDALDAGVEVWPYVAEVSEAGIGLGSRLSVLARPDWVE